MTQHCMTEKGLVVPHIYLCSFFERETLGLRLGVASVVCSSLMIPS